MTTTIARTPPGSGAARELRQPRVPDRPRADPGPAGRSTSAPSAARSRSRPRALCRRWCAAARAGAATRRSPATASRSRRCSWRSPSRRPRSPCPTEQARVMIVTDRSGSMLATDVAPNRLAAAKKAAGTFLDARAGSGARRRRRLQPEGRRAAVADARPRGGRARRSRPSRPPARPRPATPSRPRCDDITGKAPAAIVLLSDGKSVRGSDPVDRRAGRQGAQDPDLHGRARHRRAGRSTTASPCRPTRRRSRGSRRSPADARSPPPTSSSLDQVYKRLGSQVATEKRKLEVTNLFAGGALALMALSALSSIRLTRPPALTTP